MDEYGVKFREATKICDIIEKAFKDGIRRKFGAGLTIIFCIRDLQVNVDFEDM